MIADIGFLYSAFDPVRDLIEEMQVHVASSGAIGRSVLLEDLRPLCSVEVCPSVMFAMSNCPEVLQMACWLDQLGIRVINRGFLRSVGNRVSAQILMKRERISVLPFAFAANPAVFKDRRVWASYPAILKHLAKRSVWPVMNNIGELNDWLESERPVQRGWMIQQFVPNEITIKWYVVGDKCHAVNKRSRNDAEPSVNYDEDVCLLGYRIARVLGIEIGSIDMIRDSSGELWPIDVNHVPAFRHWPGGYDLLARFLIETRAEVGGRQQL